MRKMGNSDGWVCTSWNAFPRAHAGDRGLLHSLCASLGSGGPRSPRPWGARGCAPPPVSDPGSRTPPRLGRTGAVARGRRADVAGKERPLLRASSSAIHPSASLVASLQGYTILARVAGAFAIRLGVADRRRRCASPAAGATKGGASVEALSARALKAALHASATS